MHKIRLSGDDAWNISSWLDDFSTGVAAAIIVFALVLLTSPLAGVSVFFAEWMLVFLLVPIGVAYRLLFRRPWLIYAEAADGRDLRVARVVGWRESQEVISAAGIEIRRTGAPQSALWTRPRVEAIE